MSVTSGKQMTTVQGDFEAKVARQKMQPYSCTDGYKTIDLLF